MKITKAIFGLDDSHYKDYWPLQARLCREILDIEPVVFIIGEEDSDFYQDGYGTVKKVKQVNEVNTGLQACLVRYWAPILFPDDVCMFCDIDMFMLDKNYFIDQIKDIPDEDLVVFTSDAYDASRIECKDLAEKMNLPYQAEEMFSTCYSATKGKTFQKIMNLTGSFSEFVEQIKHRGKDYKMTWLIDEFYFTDCVLNNHHNVKVHRLKRGVRSEFLTPGRIEKYNFPVDHLHPRKGNPDLANLYKEHGPYNEYLLLKGGHYIDCHCIRPYGFHKEDIHKVADIAQRKVDTIRTIPIYPHSTIGAEIAENEGCIVDVGCLHWDWPACFIGHRRVVGIDPFEEWIPGAEIFKGVLGPNDGVVKIKENGLESSIFLEGGQEVPSLSWKTFCKRYNIDKVAILKINIEGAEYDLLSSMDDEDFSKIDQIAVSFHDWTNPSWKGLTDQHIALLKSKGFYVSKIDEQWGWYLARKTKPKEISKKKDLALITCYCDTKEKQEILRNLVKSFKKVKDMFDVMVISHSTVPQDIIDECEYFFYDKKNELLTDFEMRCMPWFDPNNDRDIMSIFTGKYNTHLAIWRMIITGNYLAKSFGYEKVHQIEYDCKIEDFSEVLANSSLLNEYDCITYTKEEDHVDDILFGTYQAYRIDTLTDELLYLDEDKIKKSIYYSVHKSPEKMLYDLLHQNKRGLVKNKRQLDTNGNHFGISHAISSRNHTAWCVPYYDQMTKKLCFIIWNREKENESIDVKVIYNGSHVFHHNLKPQHWTYFDIDDYENAKELITILNGEIRNTFNFDEYRESFKRASFRWETPRKNRNEL